MNVKSINDIIEDVLIAEGGYVSNPSDPGGETNFGITKDVAVKNGYVGDMKDLPISLARSIYYNDYVVKPGFDKVYLIAPTVAAELVDTGVNMSPKVAATFLQQALNAFNTDSKMFTDLETDGVIGPSTINALASYMKARKEKAIEVLLKALNCLQGAHYIRISNSNKKLKNFTFGWLDNRIKL